VSYGGVREFSVGHSKVERVIEKYDLRGFGVTLEEYWTREEDRYSLRDLAVHFNERVLQAAMEDAGIHPLDGEVENTYRLLSDDDVSRGDQRQAERKLERKNIDVSELRKDFVTHQAIHTYLREHRGVTRDSNQTLEERRTHTRETTDRLRSRAEAVIQNSLQSLARTSEFPITDFDVIVDIRVVDTDTGETYSIDDLLNQENS
jgi:hypothetical protein